MGNSLLWFVTVRLFLLAWMRLAMSLVEACMIATNLDMDSPFNIRRLGV
jgi:hypothetical protein